jgi:hypothetical protein
MAFIGLEKKIYMEKFSNWLELLPENHIETFIKYGLKPFLKKYKYTISYSDKDFAKFFKTWAFNYINGRKLEFTLCAHDGGDEEYDWYRHIISMDDWSDLCSGWRAINLFDDSDVGIYQTTDLSWFVWNCISLNNSGQHHYMLDMNTLADEEEYWVNEDSQAYGGDRRTY